MSYSGVVLAGGSSERMGRDKRFLSLNGTSLLVWVLERIRPLVTELIVVTQDPGPLDGVDARVVSDRYPGMGVLAGVHAGLKATRGDWAFVVAGDMPFLNADLLQAMARQADPAACDVVVPRWREEFEPLHALYRAGVCAEAAERALRDRRRRIVAFYPDVRVCVMPETQVHLWDPSGDSFFNVNTPKDWEMAQGRLAR
ncbi:MAG TPA: molybdenum cofactor guanylyltransferase [Anaerolineae bacterium]|nr:molybdenum cofactor guanylyltransferase [Anaerolineae bacterium]